MLTPEENQLITRTGPNTAMGTLFRRFWIPALLTSELPAPDCPPVRVRLLGEDLVAFKDSEGNIGMLDAHCPHRRADLFFGRNEETGLRCVYHGWKFDVTGACVDMPNEPAESNFKGKITATAYPCREYGGLIWAYMGPAELMPELPQLEWARVPDNHRYLHKRVQECNYFQAMEGEIDNSHVSFLHSKLNSAEHSGPVQAAPNYFAKDKAPRVMLKESNYGVMIGFRRDAEDDTYYWRLTQWLFPFYQMIPNSPGHPISGTISVPMDDEHQWGFTVTWHPDRALSTGEVADIESWTGIYTELVPGTFLPLRNEANNYLQDRALQRSFSFTGIKGIRDEDHAVQSSQGPIADRTKEHLGTSDAGMIGVRRVLMKAATDLQNGIEPYAAQHGEVYRVRAVALVARRELSPEEAAKDWLPARV